MNNDFARYPSLRDRVVLVTGGASGIGAAQVMHFAAQGARIGALFEHFVEIGRVDGPRRNRVAADAVTDVVDGHGARERGHAARLQ